MAFRGYREYPVCRCADGELAVKTSFVVRGLGVLSGLGPGPQQFVHKREPRSASHIMCGVGR